MPRVHFVKAARKDNPVAKKGESYYWWKFRFGGKRYSLTRPRRSQLTQSAYFGQLYDLIDMVEEYHVEPGEESDIEMLCSDVVDSLNEIRDECQESLDNMPEALQYAPTGELLQERIDACDNAISEVESQAVEPDQWSEIRDLREMHESWLEDEPMEADFDTHKEFKEAKLDWLDEEPELEDFEDFDKYDITGAIEECIV